MLKHPYGGFLSRPPTFVLYGTVHERYREKGITLQSSFGRRLLLLFECGVLSIWLDTETCVCLYLIGFASVLGKQAIDRHQYWVS